MEIAVTDRITIKHTAKVHCVLKAKLWGHPDSTVTLYDEWQEPHNIPSMTLLSYMYNRDISGGCDWWDPKSGAKVQTPKFSMTVNEEDITNINKPCDCERCCA